MNQNMSMTMNPTEAKIYELLLDPEHTEQEDPSQ